MEEEDEKVKAKGGIGTVAIVKTVARPLGQQLALCNVVS